MPATAKIRAIHHRVQCDHVIGMRVFNRFVFGEFGDRVFRLYISARIRLSSEHAAAQTADFDHADEIVKPFSGFARAKASCLYFTMS